VFQLYGTSVTADRGRNKTLNRYEIRENHDLVFAAARTRQDVRSVLVFDQATSEQFTFQE
jgi:hypothetical protein